MRRRERRRMLVGLAVIGMLSASCGARWTDEQQAQVAARHDGEVASASGGVAANGSTATSVVGANGATATTALGTSGPGVSQPGSSAGSGEVGSGDGGTAAALPCAQPSSAPGVTDGEITLGAINSLSGPVPGLGATYLAATQSYLAYRNATGGVCGRQLTLLSADDGMDNARYRSIVLEFDATTLGVITGIAGGGDGGAGVAEERGIPMTGTPITTELFSSPVVFGVRPSFANYDVPTPRFTYLYQQGIRRAAIVFINAAVVPAEADRHRRLMEAAGIEVVLYQGLPLSTLSYDSTARAIANSGADYAFALLDEGASASLARSLNDINYPLLAEEYPAAYGGNFPDLAGDAAEGASSWIDVLPIEDGGTNPEQAQFIQWMATTAPDARLDIFASLAWVATKAFIDSLEALPGPISREALLAQLRSNHAYDAGGMLGTIDLGSQINGGCFVGVVYQGGAWRRITPEQGFLC